MSDPRVIELSRRCGALDQELRAGEYQQRPPGTPGLIALRCPSCDGLGQLLRTVHSVDVLSGQVHPLVVCPKCDLHCVLFLADWVPEALGSA